MQKFNNKLMITEGEMKFTIKSIKPACNQNIDPKARRGKRQNKTDAMVWSGAEMNGICITSNKAYNLSKYSKSFIRA